MSKYNFEDFGSEEKLKTLIKNFEKYKKNEIDIPMALNLCSDAWHLTDFIFIEYNEKINLQNIGEFRKILIEDCKELKIMHDLANASKHYEVTRPKANIQFTKKHLGTHTKQFSREFDISRLDIILEDQTILDFYTVIENVVKFWKNYFIKLNI